MLNPLASPFNVMAANLNLQHADEILFLLTGFGTRNAQ
jgi:hypothetical protein